MHIASRHSRDTWTICRLVNRKSGNPIGPDKFQEADESLTLGNLILPRDYHCQI